MIEIGGVSLQTCSLEVVREYHGFRFYLALMVMNLNIKKLQTNCYNKIHSVIYLICN